MANLKIWSPSLRDNKSQEFINFPERKEGLQIIKRNTWFQTDKRHADNLSFVPFSPSSAKERNPLHVESLYVEENGLVTHFKYKRRSVILIVRTCMDIISADLFKRVKSWEAKIQNNFLVV